MFPEHGRNIILDKSVKNMFNVADKAHQSGYNKLTIVVGGDRVRRI